MSEAKNDVPLCVDLDGTLVRSNTLAEGCVRLLSRNPALALPLLFWRFRGRERLQAEVAARVDLDVERLPFNDAFVTWLRDQAAAGRRLILCSGATQRVAAEVARHYSFFNSVIASSANLDLDGPAKAARLAAQFGVGGYDYAGHDARDLLACRGARQVIVVEPSRSFAARFGEIPQIERIFERSWGGPRTWMRALRLHQWIKNLLIFVPAAAAHRLAEFHVALASVEAFVLFGACASGTYLLNDLTDLDADRQHPTKKQRPFAAAQLSLTTGLATAVILVAGCVAASGPLLGWRFACALAFYVAVTVWYSRRLKRVAMVDVLALAGLYSVRVIAGAAATRIVPSFWLIAFTMFMFLSLALAKRCSELKLMIVIGRASATGRGYTVEDAPLLQAFGVAAGFISILVMALYVNSSSAQSLYAHPEFLWMLCPLLLYWISRIWITTSRGQMDDDPVVFALRDVPSLVTAAVAALLVWAAS